MRWLVLILCVAPRLALAGPWGLEVGLVGSMGAANFAGDPTPLPPPVDPTNLFAIYPPSATGSQGTSLAGAAGVSFNFTRKRKLNLDLEFGVSGQSLKFDEQLTFPSGTTLKRSTVWEWSSFRPTAIASYAYPIKMGEGWALAPRLGGGAWYEKVGTRRKVIGVDGGTPTEFAWHGAPEDDWGWIVSVGIDWLMLGKGSGPKRIGLECRWRQGRALPEPAAGADKPVRVIEGVLTVPLGLWVL